MSVVLARLRGGPGDHARPLAGDCYHVLGHGEGHYAKGEPVAADELLAEGRGSGLEQVWFDWTEGPCHHVGEPA